MQKTGSIDQSMPHEILSTSESFTEALLRKVNLFFDSKIDKIPIQKGFQVNSFKSQHTLIDRPQKTQIKEWVKESPKNLNGVISKIKETWNITTSKDTIKRILKSLLMNWHRVRRVVFGEPDANEYAKKKQELEVLKEQAAAGEIDLRYFDESGFSLNSKGLTRK